MNPQEIINVSDVISFSREHQIKDEKEREPRSLDKISHLGEECVLCYETHQVGDRDCMKVYLNEKEAGRVLLYPEKGKIALVTVPRLYRSSGIGRLLILASIFKIYSLFPDIPIVFSPLAQDGSYGLSQEKLEEFYKSFGAIYTAPDEYGNVRMVIRVK